MKRFTLIHRIFVPIVLSSALLLPACGGDGTEPVATPDSTTPEDTTAETPSEPAETPEETAEETSPAESDMALAPGDGASQCQAINEIVSEGYTTALIFTPTLDSDGDGGINLIEAGLLESKVEDAQTELTEIEARMTAVESLELSYEGLPEFQAAYLAQLEEIQQLLVAANEELAALDAAIKASADGSITADQAALLESSMGIELPTNKEELSDLALDMTFASVDLVTICPSGSLGS